MKFLFLIVLFSSPLFAMESNKETGKQLPASPLTFAEKILLAKQAKVCSLMNKKIVKIKGESETYARPLSTISSDTVYSVSVSNEAHQACQQLLEQFAQSIKKQTLKEKSASNPYIFGGCEDAL